MSRFAVLFAAGLLLIPVAGCEDTGGGGGNTAASPADTNTTPATAPTGKPLKDAAARAKAASATANPNGPKNDH